MLCANSGHGEDDIADMQLHIHQHSTCGCLGLDYYPLLGQGQRFPINAPDMLPRMTPRPGSASFPATASCAGICSVAQTFAAVSESNSAAFKNVTTDTATIVSVQRLCIPSKSLQPVQSKTATA